MTHGRSSVAVVDNAATRAAMFGLDAPSRALCAVPVDGIDPTLHMFACATVAAGKPIQLLTFDDDTSNIHHHSVKHESDSSIWALNSFRAKPGFLLVTKSLPGTPITNATVSLAKIHYGDSTGDSKTNIPNPESLEEVVKLPPLPSAFAFSTFTRDDSIVTIDSNTLRFWKADCAKHQPSLEDSTVFGKTANVRTGRGDPHADNRFVGATDNEVYVWDWRDPSDGVLKITSAHPAPMKDLDVNPNKPHQIVTAGEDSSLRFWDLRRPESPALILFGHTHWIWHVEYNHHHDQLLLTSSSDCTACLWSAYSVSSSPSTTMGITESGEQHDKIIEVVKDHDESVYRSCWSATDPWVYASMAFDGRVAINIVPQAEKYKILL